VTGASFRLAHESLISFPFFLLEEVSSTLSTNIHRFKMHFQKIDVVMFEWGDGDVVSRIDAIALNRILLSQTKTR
jgi:hypothetical protein